MILGVIGTAGRGGLHKLFSANRMDSMVNAVCNIATKNKVTGLISGGAAFSDHVAVLVSWQLKLHLTLALPCAYDMVNGVYVDTGVRDFRTNPGGTANYYHRLMSQVTSGKYEVGQIKRLVEHGLATLEVYNGFFARNTVVAAKSNILVAFTFSSDANPNEPADGGTKDTWDKCSGTKIHFRLANEHR